MVETASKEIWLDIVAANETFMAYFRNADAARLASLYTEHGQAQPPNSEIVAGRPAIQEFWQGVMNAGIKAAKLTTVEVIGSGHTVTEMGRYALAVEGGQVVDEGKYVVVWVNDDRQWRLHRDIWNSSRPAPA